MHGIAHEVRNPLGGIELFAGLLAEELEDDEQKLARVARIRREIGNLNRLVGEFLDFAREEQMLLEKTDLAVWLEETVELARPNGENRGVSFEVDVATEKGWFDRQKMKAALLNVLRNAVAASPEDGVVTVRAYSAEGGLSIEVVDCGEGFSEQSLDGAFRPFFTTRQQGSGLGLAFAKKIAEAHLGTIEAGNVEGAGARVVFWIPDKDDK
jgi:signal transduction histidine kinase